MGTTLRFLVCFLCVFSAYGAQPKIGQQDVMATVATIQDMKNLNTDKVNRVTVTGYASANDGGGGDFVWDSSDATATNLGTIFKGKTTGAELTTGRWQRVNRTDGPVKLDWFGTKTSAAANAAALNAAAALMAGTQGTIEAGQGAYDFGTNVFTFQGNQTNYYYAGITIRGQTIGTNLATIFISSAASGSFLSFTNSRQVHIEKILFANTAAGNTANAIDFSKVTDSVIERSSFMYFGGAALYFSGTGGTVASHGNKFRDNILLSNGYGINVQDSGTQLIANEIHGNNISGTDVGTQSLTGVRIIYGVANWIHNNRFQVLDYGIDLPGGANCLHNDISGNYFEGWGIHAVTLGASGAVYALTMNHGWFADSGYTTNFAVMAGANAVWGSTFIRNTLSPDAGYLFDFRNATSLRGNSYETMPGDLIFEDLRMPETAGFTFPEVVVEGRRIPPTRRITMEDDLTILPTTMAQIYFLDPNGTNRLVTPTTFSSRTPQGDLVWIENIGSGTNTVSFDPTGINIALYPNDGHAFRWTGTEWSSRSSAILKSAANNTLRGNLNILQNLDVDGTANIAGITTLQNSLTFNGNGTVTFGSVGSPATNSFIVRASASGRVAIQGAGGSENTYFDGGDMLNIGQAFFNKIHLNPLAYNSTTWNGSTNAATRDELRDYFVTFDTDGDGLPDALDATISGGSLTLTGDLAADEITATGATITTVNASTLNANTANLGDTTVSGTFTKTATNGVPAAVNLFSTNGTFSATVQAHKDLGTNNTTQLPSVPFYGLMRTFSDSGVMQIAEAVANTHYAPPADPIFTGSLQVPNGAAPTVDAFGEIAGDNDAWGTSRGALVTYDGTAAVRLVGVLASDTPSNGQVPKWNTGGTITWEADNSGGSISGTDTHMMFFDGTDTPSGDAGFTYNKTTDSATLVGSITVANLAYNSATWDAAAQAATRDDIRDYAIKFDADGDGFVDVLDTGGVEISGTTDTTITRSAAGILAVEGVDVPTSSSTHTLTGKTYDSQGTGNVLKFQDYKDFIFPGRVDGAGCTIVTNDYTSELWGLATYSGTADTNGNYAVFKIGTVPLDIDTGTAMVLKNLAIRVSATDTDAAEFTIALWSPASSSAYSPTDFTSFSTFIDFDSGTLTSPAAGDVFYVGDVTLTGWAAALTAGRPFVIGIARRNGSNDDSVTIAGGTILYGRTQ